MGLPSIERNRCPAPLFDNGAGLPAGSRRSASVSGASAGSAVAPQQNPGTEAARLSRGSPTNGVNTVSPQPSASCCRRLRRRRSASSPSSGATQVSRPRRSRTMAWASAPSALRSRMALRTSRLSSDENARNAAATFVMAESRPARPPPSISTEKRQGNPASARRSISSENGRARRGPSAMSRAP